ncbi:MAG: hypothetical protein PHO80_05825 [Candidatus Gracilibacteria bacterium]|nr:hypothetical protein [Candidatus Gracilibacteria bacterium]
MNFLFYYFRMLSMGAGDFTPPSSGRFKQVSKKDLRKIQENYEKAELISKKSLEDETEYKNKAQDKLNDMIDEIL